MFKRITYFLIIFSVLGCSQPVEKAIIANETTYSQYAEQFGTTSAIFAWASYYAKCIAEVHSVAVIEQGVNRIFSSFFKSNSRIVNKAILKNSLYLQVKNQPEIARKFDEAVEAITSIVGDKAISDEIIKRVINSSSKFISGQNSKSSFDDFLNVLRKEVGGVVGHAHNLTGSLKNTYDDLIKAGYKAIDDGSSIIFKNANDLSIAKISDNSLHIKIPDSHGGGWAKQEYSDNAVKVLEQVKNNKKVYKIGTLDVSETTVTQYWSPENPLNFSKIEDYAEKYGIPVERLKGSDKFVIVGNLRDEIIITRTAVPYGGSKGGGIEIVTTSGSVNMESFHVLEIK